MPKLEVFFDHTCPFCYRGHGYLKELLPKYPGADIAWRPVEAHPKVEEPEHMPYEDLAVQGALFVKEHGGDELAYHERLYRAYFEERKRIDDIASLAELAKELGLDADAFAQALEGKVYEKALQQANDHAYEEQKVWAVPTFVSDDGRRLDSVPGVGVTKEQVGELLHALYA
ncbi:MAG: DsbA family protein [Clostridiales bacterium]|jgi:predicted DsbA family dithiol-disulfide isomerase|nr:DsbA family protein [Clostridiales bacterium]